MSKKQLVVIGNGMVGHAFVEGFVASTAAEHFEITVFGEESRIVYDRVHLSEYFGSDDADSLAMSNSAWYAKNNITLKLDSPVTAIDRSAKTISTAAETLAYDVLILATGSYPFVPPIPGHDAENCFVYRTLDDLDAIKAAAENVSSGVVIGGGLLGLEAANALKNLGLEAHVVELAPRLMPVQLDEAGGAMLKQKIEALDVAVHVGKQTQTIVAGSEQALSLQFADGGALEAGMVVFSAGIRPQDALAKGCGLDVGPRGGIVVDNHCRTSDEAIFAVGECALWNEQIFGLVGPGYSMAKAVVACLNEQADAAFTGADMSTKLKLLGVDVGSIGDAFGETPGSVNYRYSNEAEGIYKRIVVSEDGKHLLGAVLIGDNSVYDTLLQYALNGIELPKNPESLILPASEGGAPALGPDALPMSASICSCHSVSKGDIVNLMDDGMLALPEIKAATKASTGCGGCAALLKNLVDVELGKRGLEVNTDLCEHFPYTRQDLYNLIRIEGIKSFEELLSKHGTGRGCDICKPAVGAILASTWNDYILQPEHVQLQDTNDAFLGNIQKDGSYSIVPRIPGGEITPQKLITLGQIGEKYQLYTKITGGQRIDFFGARLEQLPLIWRELVAAGFESGHAYGKAVRTVKSCVGSTWCRYGVGDSAGLAVEMENRYKGLRTPHKTKFGVSGCTRECAEAQAKDVGVIAVENGWALYVCGNGGMKPRHADLLATDLSLEELYRYTDRFLMFYIKTADRLQRTSTWMENLEGGIDYLRDVVVEDRLGIGAELEAQMQHIVDTYQCEWKTTVNDPQRLKRFRSFVNSDEQDNNVLFVEERGQIRPATDAEKAAA